MQTIPVFFSVNDVYAPYLAVALASIKDNASKRYRYNIHILSDDISEQNRRRIALFSDNRFHIECIPLSERLRRLALAGRMQSHSFGAFASMTIYFRLFIPELFPQYDRGIYLDSDIVVPGDIAELWEEPMGNKLIGACADYSIQHIAPFMRYIDEYVGVDHRKYVNSGVLLMNLRRLRQTGFCERFLHWMRTYSLDTVAPDQDYLNALCQGSIHYLDPEWDAMPSERFRSFEHPRIIHFNLDSKPWLNESVPYDDLFWQYAAASGYEKEIRRRRTAFLQSAEAKTKYNDGIRELIGLAARLCSAPVSFRTLMTSRKAARLCS